MDLIQANERISLLARRMRGAEIDSLEETGPVFLGIDIGTANITTVAINAQGMPLDGEITPARVVREGIVVDYFQAIKLVECQLALLQDRLGVNLSIAASAVPPGTELGNGKVTQNILEAVGLAVCTIIDEPSAASLALDITDGVVVDVGGGTTGISVLEEGKVVYTADEATGGFHFDLVIAGALGISTDEAEQMKRDPAQQKKLFPVVRPVMEKVAAITRKYLHNYHVDTLYLVGGTFAYPGFSGLMEKELHMKTVLLEHPLLVTPMGIAVACMNQVLVGDRKKVISAI